MFDVIVLLLQVVVALRSVPQAAQLLPSPAPTRYCYGPNTENLHSVKNRFLGMEISK